MQRTCRGVNRDQIMYVDQQGVRHANPKGLKAKNCDCGQTYDDQVNSLVWPHVAMSNSAQTPVATQVGQHRQPAANFFGNKR